MSMKRTVPGGRVDAVYTQVKTGKEIIAANAVNMNDEEEDKEILENEILEDSKDDIQDDSEENEEE